MVAVYVRVEVRERRAEQTRRRVVVKCFSFFSPVRFVTVTRLAPGGEAETFLRPTDIDENNTCSTRLNRSVGTSPASCAAGELAAAKIASFSLRRRINAPRTYNLISLPGRNIFLRNDPFFGLLPLVHTVYRSDECGVEEEEVQMFPIPVRE